MDSMYSPTASLSKQLSVRVAWYTGILAIVLSLGITLVVAKSFSNTQSGAVAAAVVATVGEAERLHFSDNAAEIACTSLRARLEQKGVPVSRVAWIGHDGKFKCGDEESVPVELARSAELAGTSVTKGNWAAMRTIDGGVIMVAQPNTVQWRALLVLLAWLVVFSVILSVVLARRWAHRLVGQHTQRIGTAVEALSNRNFEARIGPIDAPNEIVLLTQAFDALGEALATFVVRTRAQVKALEDAHGQLLQTREELILAEKMASVGRVSAGLAHEVGNPLAAVLGMMDLLRGGVDDAEERDELMRRCALELERINRIVKDLLDYARPRDRDLEAVALLPLVEEGIETVRARVDGKDIEIVLAQEEIGELPKVMARKGHLRQVLINLILNAAQAVQESKGDGIIRITGAAEGGWVRVSIEDNGPGISEDDRPRIFEPFFTRRDKGTGLGLAVSQGIIESFDGTLRYRALQAGGSVFDMRMKAWTSEAGFSGDEQLE